MRLQLLGGWALAAAFALTGCNGTTPEPTPDPDDTVTRLGESTDISLADWLNKPRPELARMVKDAYEGVRNHDTDDRTERDAKLLPKLLPPIALPVLSDGAFSEKLGVSVPSYYKEGTHDGELALHLARHGDVEAALKVADTADVELRRKIETYRTERNYPVEWTQLVALTLYQAQLKVAADDVSGAAELVLLHKQLQALLDGKAAKGPLGALLLPIGRRALRDAEAAWKGHKTALANDVDLALAQWGEYPDPKPALKPGDGQERVVALLGGKAEGFTVSAATPETARRAVDLLALPVVSNNVGAVVAFLDDRKALSELLLVYQTRTGDRYPEPVNLAHHLADRSFESQPAVKGKRVRSQQFTGGGLSYDVTLVPLAGLGAVVRVHDAKAAPALGVVGADGRDFGAVHLDGTYEQARVLLGAEPDPKAFHSEKKETLARLRAPVPTKPAALVVQKAGDKDLIQSVTLRWTADVNLSAVPTLLLPLWAGQGDARFAEEEDGTGLTLAWLNAETRCALRLPFDASQFPEYVAVDRHAPDGDREKAARAFDQSQRKARLQAGRGLEFLPRVLRVEPLGVQAPEFHLGQARDRIKALLPKRSQLVQVFDLEDGYNVLFMAPAPERATYWPQELFVRFGPSGISEVRVRYQETPREGAPSLLTLLRKDAGLPEKVPAPWARLWSDLASQGAPVYYRWRDDRTVLTYQRDAGGAEVVLREWPQERGLEEVGTPLEFCSRGPEGCRLGDSRDDVLKHEWLGKPGATPDGGVVLYPRGAKNPHDTIVAYFENDKVVRVTARHRARVQEGNATQALRQAWGADLAHLGALRRVEEASGLQFLGALGWHDDRTRVRTSVQAGNGGGEMWTEWRGWPLPARPQAPAK